MPILEIHDLKKSYIGPDGAAQTVIDVLRFRLEEKEQVGLRGGSGCGKTTFLNLIAGILAPDAGEIHVAGNRITGVSEAARDRVRAAQIGYVFQNFNLLQGYTALENVALGMLFGHGVDLIFAEKLLTRMDLKDRMHYRPAQLSVGQQQRVAVARALANHPALVLADEPTGNLDRRNAGEALTLIREICREHNAALLLVSHDPEILGRFDTVRDMSEINRAMQTAGGAA